jgi:importin-7
VKNLQVLTEIIQLTTNVLLTDKELPVKVEAAVAFRTTHQGDHLMELLTIIRETENEDLSVQLLPIAVKICQHLVTTFIAVLETEDSSDNKANTAMGLFNTMETLLSVMQEHPEIITNLHPIVLQVVRQYIVYTNKVCQVMRICAKGVELHLKYTNIK